MASHRRRHNDRRPIPAASTFAAAVLLLLLLYASLSFLTPPLLDRSPLPARGFSHDANSSKTAWKRINSGVADPYRVPSAGGRFSRLDPWRSKLANNFYGCSDATVRFANAREITRPNRYLMTATSGGLNQQRTGKSSRPLWRRGARDEYLQTRHRK